MKLAASSAKQTNFDHVCLRGPGVEIKTVDSTKHTVLVAREASKLSLVFVWSQLVSGDCLPRAILSGLAAGGSRWEAADLSSADLTGSSLSGAFFGKALVKDVKLNGADLTFADMSGAVLDSAILDSADFSGANLRDTHLDQTNFSRTCLKNATLQNSTGATCL